MLQHRTVMVVLLQTPSCPLQSLSVRSVGLKEDNFAKLSEAITPDTSLQSLNVSANQVSRSYMMYKSYIFNFRH